MPLLEGLDKDAFHETLRNARQRLLDERNEHGWWTGELSSSALSTATAMAALALVDRANNSGAHATTIRRGKDWLLANQNEDGGWGDTDKSFSNISTTMLCWAAMGLKEGTKGQRDKGTEEQKQEGTGGAQGSQKADQSGATGGLPASAVHDAISRCEQWLANHAGSLAIPDLVEAVMKRYGKDRTFSVPILTMCALCGRLGDPSDRKTWKWVKQLPFELAALPQSWFNKVNLQVVSYALPALIAIGHVRHHHRPTWNPITRLFRAMAKQRTLRRLEAIQPPNGGFLEATPLTSFVTMSLAACGLAQNPVAQRGVDFITQSMRDNGSWPIDTNLATWVTTLSVNALAGGGKLNEHLNEDERITIRDWLLDQQYTEVHPYTGAKPGGWSWTDLPGGVPDADDTSGAVLALSNLGVSDKATRNAGIAAIDWIIALQNRDDGIPTFCRGWGRLPFDRSSADITAHAVRAMMREGDFRDKSQIPISEFASTVEDLPRQSARICGVTRKAMNYLVETQRIDGAWLPLWFGNQHISGEVNPTYGTARVMPTAPNYVSGDAMGMVWFTESQCDDGGWGSGDRSPPSIEETALAIDALTEVTGWESGFHGVIVRGVRWLIEHTQRGTHFPPSPIGFYFAKLWYYEKLYPIIYTVAALERVAALIEEDEGEANAEEDSNV